MKTGYYWVKKNNEWLIADYFWESNSFLIHGESYNYKQKDFDAINPDRIIMDNFPLNIQVADFARDLDMSKPQRNTLIELLKKSYIEGSNNRLKSYLKRKNNSTNSSD